MENLKSKLINLITPYMNKNLTEGCYIELDNGKIVQVFFIEDTYIVSNSIKTPCKKLEYKEDKGLRSTYLVEGSYKIIGHYDLTAVLTYLYAKFAVSVDDIDMEDIKLMFDGSLKYIPGITQYIPNKPLTEYTKEELTALIELLELALLEYN